ncbi:hypothetical protein ACCE15_02360 [Pseudomonas parafulva]|uniref:hypothetical protein n=1 Tax=Pseudomonas TaxID=286 RepID=UPI0006D42914|nr:MULTISPECIES: hypothetical protein [Pseudomonas]RSC28873.1 hypothetical protein EGT09_21550 [Pseudomonas putida]HEK0908852.1 hypothetical protein [Pseudomonas putida]HEK1770669.1 hypothetical protein [Pseudomonas putida]
MSDDKQVTTTDAGLLVEGNLLACGAGMTAQSRHDVKNAFHFATLVADKTLDIEENGKAWYDKFLDAMRDLGFTTPHRSFELETSSEVKVTLGAVAVRVIGATGSALLGGTTLGVLAKKGFDKLTNIENDTRIIHHKKKSKARGVVGMAACLETEQGDVVMVMSCVRATEPNLDEDVLGVQFQIEKSEYYAGHAVLTLNNFVYDKVRATVEEKLGVRSVENVLQYDI